MDCWTYAAMASESGYMIRSLRCPDCSFLSQKRMSPYGWYNPHITVYIYIYITYIYIYVINPHEISTMVISHHSIPAVHFLHLLLSPIPNFRSGFFLESPSHHGCLIFPILVIVLSDYPINIPFISPEKIPGSWDFGQYIPFIFHS